MSNLLYGTATYSISNLLGQIEMGSLGLPDIQRPFIWKKSKVRDLFDSMYRGYPVGYLLLWQNFDPGFKAIGADPKQLAPSMLIVDGQQRLTSLYAVMKREKIITRYYKDEYLTIAFDPLEEKFAVTDATTRKDRRFLSDISVIWRESYFDVADEFVSSLATQRTLSQSDITHIKESISRLHNLQNFPLTALVLDQNVAEEDIADVFVRINSKGATLNLTDFILTLMSVHWEEGRKQLERFCREAQSSGDSATPSAYNHFLKPTPDQLLRVGVGLAFKRARLQYVYSILRGKNLETEKFSAEARTEQFSVLRYAQAHVLNLYRWHEFWDCILAAGFRKDTMITSTNNLIYSYMFFLIGKTEFNVDDHTLRASIARWFFMCALKGRYTSSPESAMEADLLRLRYIDSGQEFVDTLNNICDVELTDDYWTMTLPNSLNISSARSPVSYAYLASLVLLDATVLYSAKKLEQTLIPTLHPPKNPVERHHLFPKAYLKTLEKTTVTETNQMANFAWLEWKDNAEISNSEPFEYVPVMEQRSRKRLLDLEEMHKLHALPPNWHNLDYEEFLSKRRELIARVIRMGFDKLSKVSESRIDRIANFAKAS